MVRSVRNGEGAPVDEFEVFFSFYGLLLGLAAAEILSSLGLLVRERSLRLLRARSAMLASLTFLIICASWIDAWSVRRFFALDFSSLWAPIGAATTYYLAASVVLPRKAEGFEDLDAYFEHRKRFVVLMLVAAELFVKVIYIPSFVEQFRERPMLFWLHAVPLNLMILATFAAMYFARGRAANLAAIGVQMILFVGSYWWASYFTNLIRVAYDYPPA